MFAPGAMGRTWLPNASPFIPGNAGIGRVLKWRTMSSITRLQRLEGPLVNRRVSTKKCCDLLIELKSAVFEMHYMGRFADEDISLQRG